VTRRSALLLPGALATLGFLVPTLSACDSSSSAGAPTAAVTTRPPSSLPSITPTPGPSKPVGFSIAVTVTGGTVTPAAKTYQVAEGTPVSVTVTSDKADEVHSHCSHQEQPVPAGGTVTLSFTATEPGVCEIETHVSGLVLLRLAVA
jgi:hypothetical protein